MNASSAPPSGTEADGGPAREEPWDYGTRLDQPLGPSGELGPASPVDPSQEPPTAGGGAEAGRSDGPPRREQAGDAPNRAGNQQESGTTAERSGEGRDPDGERESDPDDTGDKDKAKGDEPNDEADGKADEPPPPPSKWVFVAAGVVLVALLAWGGYGRWKRDHAAGEAQQASADRVPEVRTTEAKRDDKPVDLTLPGQTEAFATASLYARATGYVTERHADIGSRVKKGDLLLHIAAPDLDQQLAQAEAQVGQVQAAEAQAHAQVAQAEANVNLAKVTLARTNQLTERGYETLQNRDNQTATLQSQSANLDTARAGVKVAEANTRAQLATVDRLKALAAFEDVRAPFDGVVTVRTVDVGDLVSSDNASASPLFSIAQDDVIRVTVQVPQNNAVGVRNGLSARIEVPQLPGQVFNGAVTRSSVALLSSARTLDTEVDIPNPDGRLRPGLFTYVSIGIPRTKPEVVIPAEALIFNQHGLQVAVVEGEKVRLAAVKVSRDFGTTVALVEGLDGGEQVVLSPPAMLKDGAKIKAKPAEDKRPEGGDQPDKTKPEGSDSKSGGGDKPGGENTSQDKNAGEKSKQPG